MSGRPVPMGLRVLTPHETVFYVDAAVASWARSDREQPSRRLLPGSWIAWSDHLRRIGVTKNWGQSEFSAARRRWRCGAAPWAGRDAPGERRRNLPLKALIAERPFAVGGGAQRIKESRIERWPKQCPVCPAVGRRAAKLEIERMVGGQGVGGRQSARA